MVGTATLRAPIGQAIIRRIGETTTPTQQKPAISEQRRGKLAIGIRRLVVKTVDVLKAWRDIGRGCDDRDRSTFRRPPLHMQLMQLVQDELVWLVWVTGVSGFGTSLVVVGPGGWYGS